MRLIILTLLISSTFCLHGVVASPSLKRPLNLILTHKESAALIKRVESQGALKISYVPFGKDEVHALWDADERMICINSSINPTESQIINSIIFELHNALSSKELKDYFSKAERGIITKEQFVESVERMEHRNAIIAQKLIANGIAIGKFSESCRANYFHDFDDYYIVQQVFGHSQWIAARFDEFSPLPHTPFRGTLASLPVNSNADQSLLLNYISAKNDLMESGIETRLDWVEQNYALAKPKEIALLNYVFDKDLSAHPLYFCKAIEISRNNG